MVVSGKKKQVLVGVTGGIAAYKAVILVRELVRRGHSVQVVMTEGAKAFIQPLTFQALTGHATRDQLLDTEAELGMGHIELARWADLIVVAPATADFIARVAHGMANDLLTTVCLAATCPVAVAPAMNQAMFTHPATQANLALLGQGGRADRYLIWGPDSGDQACGDSGPGRMVEPDVLVQQVEDYFVSHENRSSPVPQRLAGKHVVITAGPTREAIDPVRYITNHSSGKMGYALAAECARQGARVTLISGPTQLASPAGVHRIPVESACDMLDAVQQVVGIGADVFIASAAVADYRPATVADQKIKKNRDDLEIRLVKNPDIVTHVASMTPRPFVVGFAAETCQVEQYAREKLERKKLDMIVANDVSDKSIGFNSDENAAILIWPNGRRICPRQAKADLAAEIVEQIEQLMNGKKHETTD